MRRSSARFIISNLHPWGSVFHQDMCNPASSPMGRRHWDSPVNLGSHAIFDQWIIRMYTRHFELFELIGWNHEWYTVKKSHHKYIPPKLLVISKQEFLVILSIFPSFYGFSRLPTSVLWRPKQTYDYRSSAGKTAVVLEIVLNMIQLPGNDKCTTQIIP